MAKVRVPLHRQDGFAAVDTEATKGATLGENLYRQDGSVVTEADLQPAAAASGGLAVTLWRLVREIPANIQGLAAVTTNGWFRKDGATIVAREIAGTDLPDLADSGTGSLLAITRDAKGRVSGTKAATITGTAGRTTVANGDAVAGLPTVDLATVADGGGGSLLRIVRDAWGRITGTSTPTTTDLAEGTNLYHTAQRVRDTVLTGLSTATNAVITATDTVLAALGKLQAQISGLIVQTITDGDTTHAPSGDAVFDALALKSDDAQLTAIAALSANQALANATNTKVNLNTESVDTDNCFNTTNGRFTPTKAGLYLVNSTTAFVLSSGTIVAGERLISAVWKNGAQYLATASGCNTSATTSVQAIALVPMNGTTDYIEMYARRDTGATYEIGSVASLFSAIRLSA